MIAETAILTHNTDRQVQIFAALGNPTRLILMSKLAQRAPCSIAHLTNDIEMTRQAITRHLQVLKDVGLVKNTRRGRENLFELKGHCLGSIQQYLDATTTPL